RRDRRGDVPRPIDPVGQRFDLRDCEVRLQVDRPPRSRAQHEMGLDVLHAPEDLQKANAVDRTGRTRNPHDDLLHGRSILETPHWRKAAPLRFKPSILRSASREGLGNRHAKASKAEFSGGAANRRITWRHFLRVFSAGIVAWSGIGREPKSAVVNTSAKQFLACFLSKNAWEEILEQLYEHR